MRKTRSKPETSGSASDEDAPGNVKGPLVGALLRLAHAEAAAAVKRALAAAGHHDLHPPHNAVTQLLSQRPDGVRGTDLAVAARVTKQSMAVTIDQLLTLGYVERAPDPSDRRAQLVRLTRRGWEAVRISRSAVRELEKAWARRVGAERLASMRDVLADIVATYQPEGA